MSWSPIVELRQYTLHPGKRDVLIDIFDREFIESQEALGMKVIGQFRDLDDSDRLVWLRGTGLVVASIYSLDKASAAAFIDYVEDELRPALTDLGAAILAYFVTESSANNFPALPFGKASTFSPGSLASQTARYVKARFRAGRTRGFDTDCPRHAPTNAGPAPPSDGALGADRIVTTLPSPSLIAIVPSRSRQSEINAITT